MNREIVLSVHTILGVIVFATGILQILLKKGGVKHRIIGNIYLYSWLFLLISGVFLGGLIITIVGVFGFYSAITGARIGRLKNGQVTWFEKAIFLIGGLAAISLIYYAVMLYLNDQQSWSIILAVFGGLFLKDTTGDIFKYVVNKPLKKQKYGNLDWYFEHFKRISISFIAAVTAFTSTQNIFKIDILNFLMPTVIGIILIFFVTKSYKKKLLK